MTNPGVTAQLVQQSISMINDSTFRALKTAQEENWISEEQIKGFVNQLVTAVTSQLRDYNGQAQPQ